VVGAGIAQIWRWQAHRPWVNALLVLAVVITILFQIFTAHQSGVQSFWVYLPLILLIGGGGLLLIRSLRSVAFMIVLVSMLMIPLVWTGMTVLDKAPNTNLPTSIGSGSARQTQFRPAPELNERNKADEDLAAYLQANTQDTEYLVAVPNAHTGSPLVLATGRPVLYMGGFTGSDPVIDAAGLAEMVAEGELRYVLFGDGRNNKQDIINWLSSSCTIVPVFNQGNARPAQQGQRPGGGPGGLGNQATTLYRCG